MKKQSLGQQFKNDFDKYRSYTKTSKFYYILALLLFVAFTPFLFSKFSIIPFDADTGVVGDTIGGITAPFVNLIAAYLVYKSFKAQIDSNNLLKKRNYF